MGSIGIGQAFKDVLGFPKTVLQDAGVVSSGQVPGQTGIQGYDPSKAGSDPFSDPSWVKQADGSYVNSSGRVMDANGNVLTTPTAANQVTSTQHTAADYFNSAPGWSNITRGAVGGENALSATLANQIAGNGPTVAGNQLAAGQQQAAQQQLAQAAGASGNGAMLSRLAAMGNTAGLQAQTNQQAAGLRAQEQLGAIGAQTNLLNNIAGQGAQMSLGNSQIGAGLTQDANTLESQREGLNQTGAQNSAKSTASGWGAGLTALSSL